LVSNPKEFISSCVRSMYDEIVIKIYDCIPKKEGIGNQKRVVLHPNLVLFNLFGVTSLNNSCNKKIQPLVNFRPKSPLHSWKFETMEAFKLLFILWKVEPPTRKVVKHKNKGGEPEVISFIEVSKDLPIQVSFSSNTSKLCFQFSWKIVNIQQMTTLNIKF
jgi:hypothetical protein